MRTIFVTLLAILLLCSTATADQVCVKKRLNVGKSGRINLQKAISVEGECAANQLTLLDTEQLQGPPGAPGEQGVPGPLVQNLPSGETLRGRFRVGAAIPATAHSFISFPFPVASTPSFGWVIDAASYANCPGTVDSPEAAPGYFCLYTSTPGSLNWSTINFSNVLTRFGYALQVTGSGTNGSSFYMDGTWAVTAP